VCDTSATCVRSVITYSSAAPHTYDSSYSSDVSPRCCFAYRYDDAHRGAVCAPSSTCAVVELSHLCSEAGKGISSARLGLGWALGEHIQHRSGLSADSSVPQIARVAPSRGAGLLVGKPRSTEGLGRGQRAGSSPLLLRSRAVRGGFLRCVEEREGPLEEVLDAVVDAGQGGSGFGESFVVVLPACAESGGSRALLSGGGAGGRSRFRRGRCAVVDLGGWGKGAVRGRGAVEVGGGELADGLGGQRGGVEGLVAPAVDGGEQRPLVGCCGDDVGGVRAGGGAAAVGAARCDGGGAAEGVAEGSDGGVPVGDLADPRPSAVDAAGAAARVVAAGEGRGVPGAGGDVQLSGGVGVKVTAAEPADLGGAELGELGEDEEEAVAAAE
jgi:hypothetical protein